MTEKVGALRRKIKRENRVKVRERGKSKERGREGEREIDMVGGGRNYG